MTINLITADEHKTLVDIQKNFPALTYQSKGYEGNQNKLTEEDKEQHTKAVEIISKSVIGYSEFNHFIMRRKKGAKVDTPCIRLQYNYGAEDDSMSFTGVGYLTIDELRFGFD